MVECRGDLRRE